MEQSAALVEPQAVVSILSAMPCTAPRRKAVTRWGWGVGGGLGGDSEQLVLRHSQPQPPPPSVLGPALWAPSTQGPCIPPASLPGSGLASPCPGTSTSLRQVPVRLGHPRTGGLPALTPRLCPCPAGSSALCPGAPGPAPVSCLVLCLRPAPQVRAAPGASLWTPSSPSSEGSGGSVPSQPQPPSHPGMGRDSLSPLKIQTV